MANSNGWGDGAANNAIGWGQGANNNIGWGSSHATSWAGATDIVGLTTDPSASAFIAATGITGATQQSAVDALVKGLKADGLWSKMKAVYPFVTDNKNLFSYTDDFSNAYWVKNNATITTNTAIAPDGTLTADTLIPSAGSNVSNPIVYNIMATTVETRTLSFYAKPNGYDYAFARIGGGLAVPITVFLLTGSGSVATTQNAISSSITSVGNGWYRCTITYAHGNINYAPNIGCCSSIYTVTTDNVLTTTNGTSGIYMWGAQVEANSTATTYQPIATTQQAFIASQFKYNLVNPVDSDAAFRLVFNGGWTHSSTGATPNGTNGYADTKLVPSSVLTQNSASMGIYSRTNNTGAFTDYGAYSVIGIWQRTRKVDNTGGGYVNAADQYTANTSSLGLYCLSRISSANFSFYKNGTPTLFTSTSTGIPAVSVYIGAGNLSATAIEYSTRQYAFQYVSDGLTDFEISNLTTRVQTYQTALSRNV